MRKIIPAAVLMLSLYGSSFAQVKIGLALPLENNEQGVPQEMIGEMMLKGMNEALREYNEGEPKITVETVVRDTRKDPETALEIVNKFGLDKNISAVLGPVFSSELVQCAGAAGFHKIPVISPTATQSFIAEENPFVYQLNPTYDVRGRLIAKYAHDKLGMRRFIVLAENSYGKQYSDAFESQVREMSDTVLYTKYYSKESEDLETEISEIRNFILQFERFIDFGRADGKMLDLLKYYGLSETALDTLSSGKYYVSVYKLFPGEKASEIISKGLGSKYDGRLTEIVFGFADAFYIPVSNHEEIPMIARELNRQGLDLTILGTSDWNFPETLLSSSDILPEVYFEADFVLDESVPDSLKNMNDTDLRNYFFGYGSMMALLECVKKGSDSREEIENCLSTIKEFRTPYNTLKLIDRRNCNMNIIMLKDSKLIKIGNYSF